MNELLIYLSQVALVSAFFYLIYWLLLRTDIVFRRRRSYLLIALILPFFLPFIPLDIPIDVSGNSNFIEPIFILDQSNTAITDQPSPPIKKDSSLLNFLLQGIWLFGAGLMALRLLIILFQLTRICINTPFSKFGNYHVGRSAKIETPCSFFYFILLPASTDTHEEIVITHESIHARQLHTFDILLSEFTLIFQWFNPTYWLIRRSLREVHEYLADEGVLQAGFSPKIYQMLLLTYSAGKQQFALANAINQLTIIKRINMMNRRKSSRFNRFRYLAIIPVICICLFFTNCRPSMEVSLDSRLLVKGQVFRTATQEPLIGAAVLAHGTNMGSITDVNGEFKLAIPRTFFQTEKQPALAISYVDIAFQTFPISQDGELKVWIDNDPSKSSHQFEEKDMSAELAKLDIPAPLEDPSSTDKAELSPAFKYGATKQPLFIVDGEAVKNQKGLNDIEPDNIKEIIVISNKKSPEKLQTYLDKYGERAQNGVVIVTTK